MAYLAIFMSGLALLAATGSLVVTILEKKRSKKQNAALLEQCREADKKWGETLLKKIQPLEEGICPNMEEAKKAAEALDDFNTQLNAILGYDPFRALEKQRNREG